MNLISVFDRLTHKRLCYLKNAYGIGYTLNMNGLHTALFTMPSDDGNNKYCKPLNYVEIWDNHKRVELFRILPSKFTKNANTKTITYNCEHVMATLLDDILFKFHSIGNTGTYTPTVIQYILAKQIVKRWNLQECAFKNQFLYTWENENLLRALFSVATPFTEDYIWQYDTRDMGAWQLSLKLRSTKQMGELRYKKNMQGVTKSVDPSKLCTRLYVLGYGEGDNQLSISSVNGGVAYLDSDTINQYGIISKISVDRSIQDEASLLAYGKTLREEVKYPYISYDVEAAAIGDNIQIGDMVRVIDDEENLSELMPVIAINKTNVTGAQTVKYTIANKSQDIAQSLADISNRQRIADLYSQGGVNIDTVSFQDNADASNPAKLRFYISDKVVRVNAINFIYSFESFRAYSKATLGGGGSFQTSSGGGGGSTTSRSSGGVSKATRGGGGTIFDWPDVIFRSGAVVTEYADGTGNHYHRVGQFGISFPRVNLIDHYHEFSVDPHSHTIDFEAHTHNFQISDHYHDILYGIYNGSSANSAQIKVDNTYVSIPPNTNFNVVKYLSVDSQGKIQRGTWHTIEIIPNTLTRIEASIQNIVFINPRGGQDL